MKDEKNNSGENNSGDRNSGYRNSGSWNSGYRNSGDRNSGDGNSGDGNSGDGNSGYGNSGSWNSGDRNSGYGNSGSWNSGYRNSGSWNSGYGNSTNRESGIFCSNESTVRMFNKPTDLKWEEINHPHFNEFYLNRWISESDMSNQEKKENKDFHVCGGYLKKFEWENAWSNFWNETDEENKQTFLNLPNFDAEIFKEITGIEINKNTCEGRIIEIDGVEYKLKLNK